MSRDFEVEDGGKLSIEIHPQYSRDAANSLYKLCRNHQYQWKKVITHSAQPVPTIYVNFQRMTLKTHCWWSLWWFKESVNAWQQRTRKYDRCNEKIIIWNSRLIISNWGIPKWDGVNEENRRRWKKLKIND